MFYYDNILSPFSLIFLVISVCFHVENQYLLERRSPSRENSLSPTPQTPEQKEFALS